MRFLSSERLSEHKYKTPEGYLICTDAILARTGKQTYRKNEVFADSDDDSEIEVDRRPEDVFSNETLASFENKPITVEHPDRDVTAENHNELSVGFVRDVRRATRDGQDVMIGNLVITDADTIEEIENGEHCELSCGYDCDIEDEANPVQRNIRGNHVALCEHGRAGIARIVDSVKDNFYAGIEENKLRQSNDFKLKELFADLDKAKNKSISIDKENEIANIKQKIEQRVKQIKNITTFDSIESDFEDVTNMSDAKIILNRYGIELTKQDNRNYTLSKNGQQYKLYVLENPNEVRKDLVRAVHKLVDSVKDSYYTEREKQDKEFVRNAIHEMQRYVDNWNFMTAKEKRNIEATRSELKARIAELRQSLNDSTAPSDLERIPYEARQEMKNTDNKGATLTGICGQLQDIVNRADDIEKDELKRKANKILNDLKAQFKVDASHLVVDATKNVSEIKEYFRVWGYPSRSELQEVVNFYRLSKDEMKQVFGNHYDETDLNKLKYHDSIKDDMIYNFKPDDLKKVDDLLTLAKDEDEKRLLNNLKAAIKYELKAKEMSDELIQSGSEEALQKNIKTEIEAGKDPKQAAVIAYSVQRKNDSLKKFEIYEGNNITLVRAKDLADALKKVK